ncbi:MAG: hypothetical protein R2769_02210 [Saprospiraceae bacterium]
MSHYVSDFDNQEGNVFSYSESPVYSYYQFIQKDVNYTSTSNEKKSKIGADEVPQVFIKQKQYLQKCLSLHSQVNWLLQV